MTVYLLGVSHDFQQHASSEFVDYILHLHKRYRFRSIGEEMNQDSLSDARTKHSVPKTIADSLGLLHSYCDPDRQERAVRGICGDQDIELSQWYAGFSNKHKAKLIAANHKLRELMWLERITQLLLSPTLFICGTDHLISFQAILKEHGHDCYILEKTFSSCCNNHLKSKTKTNKALHHYAPKVARG